MNVRFLSNQELDDSLKRLVVSERRILNLILEHILEVESRKMFLEKAYASTYDYLVKELGYSGSAAMRRLSAARLLKDVPDMSGEIQEGNINLSQITELSRAIKEKEKTGAKVSSLQKKEIISAIAGKSTAESQKEIAKSLDVDLKPPEKTLVQKDDSVHLQLTLSKEQYENLLRCRDLASNKLLSESKDTSLAAIIDLLSVAYLKKFNESSQKKIYYDNKETRVIKESKEVMERAENKVTDCKAAVQIEENLLDPAQRNTNAVTAGGGSNTTSIPQSASPNAAGRTLTPKIKKAVLARDQHCQYQDPESGRVCGTRFNLTVDHIQPRWADGDHCLHNLQTLCQGHNNHKYRSESNLRLF